MQNSTWQKDKAAATKCQWLMPWGKGSVVIGAKGFVFLAGNTATADDYDRPQWGM
jgi:hypothetical protein